MIYRDRRPTHRVVRAMRRLSRDKLISPDEVRRLSFEFAQCAAPHCAGSIYSRLNGYPMIWGMIDGTCPINPHIASTENLRERLLSEYRRNKIDSALITILQIVVMEEKYRASRTN